MKLYCNYLSFALILNLAPREVEKSNLGNIFCKSLVPLFIFVEILLVSDVAFGGRAAARPAARRLIIQFVRWPARRLVGSTDCSTARPLVNSLVRPNVDRPTDSLIDRPLGRLLDHASA